MQSVDMSSQRNAASLLLPERNAIFENAQLQALIESNIDVALNIS